MLRRSVHLLQSDEGLRDTSRSRPESEPRKSSISKPSKARDMKSTPKAQLKRMSTRVRQADEEMPCRALRLFETRRSHARIVVHHLPLLGWRTSGARGRAVLVEEHFFDVLAKGAGNLKCERKTRLVAACFDGVDAGAS